MAEQHSSRPTSWATVAVLMVGFILVGVALPAHSLLLGVLGLVALLAGVVMLFAFHVMEDFY